MSKRRVFILIPNLLPNDAVGNDALGMLQFLHEAGYETHLMAGQMDSRFRSTAELVTSRAGEQWRDPNAIVIYHHAIQWDLGEEILQRSANRIAVKYHNITPPTFFAPYAQHYVDACANGMEATRRLARLRIDFVWGASAYNCEDFIRLGFPRDRCRALPPIHHVEDLGASPLDAVVLGKYRVGGPNIVFVGAFRPNKGHLKALEVFSAYRRMGGRAARLLFAGQYDPALHGYVSALETCARALELDGSMEICASVSPSQLRSLYTVADVFLCVSEHEGFCVPLVEAMFFRVPIVAWGASAIAETCDGCGRIFPEFHPDELARALDECIENPPVARDLADRGRGRYEAHYSPKEARTRLLRLMREVES